MSEHTRGQWIAVGAWVEIADYRIADICTCNTEDIYQHHLGRSYEEMCANARLIAAAPDFLLVCQRLAAVNVFSADNDVAQIIMQACDAVSKATGEKS